MRKILARIKETPSPFDTEFGDVSTAILNEKELRKQAREKRLASHKVSAHELMGSLTITALCARLAAADNAINADEMTAFLKLFPQARHPSINTKDYMEQSAKDTAPLSHYVSRLRKVFPGDKRIEEELLRSLIVLAAIDGPINVHEIVFLHALCEAFGLSSAIVLKHVEQLMLQSQHSPKRMLGVRKGASKEECREAYYTIARRFHPDYTKQHTNNIAILALTQAYFVKAKKAYNSL